jgi:hypothetical protein
MAVVPRVDDIGTEIIVDMQVTITGATGLSFDVRKPSYPETGGTDTWVPSIYNVQYLRYVIQTGDLDEEGTYWIVPKLTLGTWSGAGDPVSFKVYGLFEE